MSHPSPEISQVNVAHIKTIPINQRVKNPINQFANGVE